MESSFQSSNFPYKLCPHGSKRELLINYGTVEQVDATGGSTIETHSKSIIEGSRPRLAAIHPVLPLEDTPGAPAGPWKDRIMGNDLFLYQCTKNMKNSLNTRKIIPKTFIKQLKSLTAACNKLIRFKRNNEKEQHLLDSASIKFRTLVNEFRPLCGLSELKNFNSEYSGGCLGYLPCQSDSDTVYLLSPSNQDFTDLKLQSVHVKGKGLLQTEVISQAKTQGFIYQICCKEVQSKSLCAVRTQTCCSLYDINSDEKSLNQLCGTAYKLRNPTSVDLSNYIPGEYLVTTQPGKTYLWNTSGIMQVIPPQAPRFTTTERWRHSHFGSHPRQVIYADPTKVELFDLRLQCDATSIDLFSLPSKFLHKKERVSMAANHPSNPFYHIVSTDYSLILIDERFPEFPVLHWSHPMLGPPQYIQGVDKYGNSLDDHAVFLGTQVPAEVQCFRFKAKGDKPLQLYRDPWRPAKMEDMSKWLCYIHGRDPNFVKHRFHTSLAGFQAVQLQSDLAVFQMDSLGEIFYQMYRESEENLDKTFTAGLKSSSLTPDDIAMETGRKWISQLELTANKQALSNPGTSRDATTKFQEMCTKPAMHVSCRLCVTMATDWIAPAKEEIWDFCSSCLHTLGMSHQLWQLANHSQNPIVKVPPYGGHDDLLKNQLTDMDKLSSKSVLSRLLLKEWNEETDIEDLLEERDKEVKERKLILHQNKAILQSKKDMSILERLKVIERMKSDLPIADIFKQQDSENKIDQVDAGAEENDGDDDEDSQSAGYDENSDEGQGSEGQGQLQPSALSEDSLPELDPELADDFQMADFTSIFGNSMFSQSQAENADVEGGQSVTFSQGEDQLNDRNDDDEKLNKTPQKVTESVPSPNTVTNEQDDSPVLRSTAGQESDLRTHNQTALFSTKRQRRSSGSSVSSVSSRKSVASSVAGFILSPQTLLTPKQGVSVPSTSRGASHGPDRQALVERHADTHVDDTSQITLTNTPSHSNSVNKPSITGSFSELLQNVTNTPSAGRKRKRRSSGASTSSECSQKSVLSSVSGFMASPHILLTTPKRQRVHVSVCDQDGASSRLHVVTPHIGESGQGTVLRESDSGAHSQNADILDSDCDLFLTPKKSLQGPSQPLLSRRSNTGSKKKGSRLAGF